jgi:glutamine amidotransferase
MCELFALSSSSESEVSFSLDEFSKHGGLTNHHRHGWGIAYYAQNTARIIKEASPASQSACMDFVKNYNIRSHIIMSHIRYATQGQVSFRNTQPFSRELAGVEHVFTHNGDMAGIVDNPRYQNLRFRPYGETDSESAFCYLLKQMAIIWDAPNRPSLQQRYQVFIYFADEMQTLGLANFIYSDSEYIFLYSDKRIVKDQSAEKRGDITLPGLHVLLRSCRKKQAETQIKGLQLNTAQNVVLISSVPLNNENWLPLANKETMVLKDGQIIEDIL